jgi:hypothetical protein
MKAFNLPTDSRLKLIKATPRKEHHGDDLRQAISLRLRWETTNEHLALLHPNLKDMLFYRTEAVDAQAMIAGVPDITPNLRVPDVTLPLKIELDYSGYTFNIEHGIDESSALELYTCALDKFAVDAKEGGSVFIDWSLSSNKEITPELVGALCGLEGEEIIATLTPPAIATGEAIDGSVGAFKADHPNMDDGEDAGDLFAQSQGVEDDAEPDEYEEEAAPPPQASRRNQVVARYRNAATGETWSGRGLQPKWLKSAINAGASLNEFEVPAGASSTAAIE